MRKCPECGGKLLTIVYGLPIDEIYEHAEEKGLYFAGCCVDLYKYHCKKCGTEFTKDFKMSRHKDDNIFASKKNDGEH